MLTELFNAILTKRPLNKKVFEGKTEADWQQCYDMALAQGVLAMTFPAISSLPKEQRPPFELFAKWMTYTQSIAAQSQYKRQVVEKIGQWLSEDGLSTLILKGFSLSVLYPNPNLREFCDIDIFSGSNYDAVNDCFAKHGVKVSSVDGHHAYLIVDGVSVEHHFAFHNTKVKQGYEGPEEELQKLALRDRKPTSVKGICFPNPLFTAFFVGWHAYEHFLQEKIQLRHVIDWALALRQLANQETELLNEIIRNTGWGCFTDALTAIAIHQLNLPKEWFPVTEVEAVENVSIEQEQKVWNDILYAPHTAKSKSSSLRRINIAKRIMKNNWKFKTYSNINATQLLLMETMGHLKHKTVN
jgi:hypothetical protein